MNLENIWQPGMVTLSFKFPLTESFEEIFLNRFWRCEAVNGSFEDVNGRSSK